MEQEKLFLDTMPESNGIWKEIGGNYDNAGQSIHEMTDNAISDIVCNNPEKKKIEIMLEETNDIDSSIIITVQDSGEGIEDEAKALTLGCICGETTLNEHGFGLNQALAAANPDNDAWDIYKRSAVNREKNEIIHVMAPYIIGKQPYEKLKNSKWPGHKWSNTYIKVKCKFELFRNMIPAESSVRQNLKFDFECVADRIYEDLGFVYSNIIQKSGIEMNFVIKSSNGTVQEYPVKPLVPIWTRKFEMENEKLHIMCNFGEIEKLPARLPFNNKTSDRYYKSNMFSNGVEVRVNGRIMEHNKFEEIFGKKNDHHYNPLLIQVDIISDNREDLPETRTTKNGFRVGDKRLQDIYAWIRKSIKPGRENLVKPIVVTELEQKKKLAEVIEEKYFGNQELELNVNDKITSREVPVFTSILKEGYPKIDLLINKTGYITIIEAKKNAASMLDIYQLKMYCDGYFMDNDKMPNEAILVAKSFPEGVRRLVSFINENDKRYPQIQFKYWNEFKENFEEELIEEKKLKLKY